MMRLIERGKAMKYTTFTYLDVEDIKNCERLIDSKEMLVLVEIDGEKATFYWAAETLEGVISSINKATEKLSKIYASVKKVFIEFVPEDLTEELGNSNFEVYVQYAGFWTQELDYIYENKEVKVREIKEAEYGICSNITKACVGQSRGFFGEDSEAIREWNEKKNNTVYLAEYEGETVGMIMLQVYGQYSEKGTCLFLREVAVNPKYASKGIGRTLITKGFQWGKENGAVRSFLHCDIDNRRAIKIYNDFGYKQEIGPCEIRMVKSI